MNIKLVTFLIAVTATFLVACSPETGPSPARITGTDSSTASATATTAATASPTAETPPAIAQVATTPAEPQSEPTAAPEPTTPTRAPTLTPTDIAAPKPAALQVTIAPVPINLPQYDRTTWKHWTDHDRDCQNARHEVLMAESLIAPSFRADNGCIVEAGQWLTPYSAIAVTDPDDLDIDHMVPLRNAHDSGAWAWTEESKQLYANYLDDPQHLIAVAAKANRAKGARGPEDWKPDDQ